VEALALNEVLQRAETMRVKRQETYLRDMSAAVQRGTAKAFGG
jgi:hypothetical protein